MNNWLFILISTVSLCSCTQETLVNDDDLLLAEVFNRKLYLSELQGLEFDGKTNSDSVMFVQRFVEKWIHESLFLHEAEKSLSQTRKIDKLVKNYRSSLLIHEYETTLCETELDTAVSREELLRFYEKNKQLYQLKSPILRCNFMKIPLIASDLQQMDNLWGNNDVESQIILSDYCNKYAENYNLNNEKWFRLAELKKLLPKTSLNQIQSTKSFKIEDKTYYYAFRLLDWVPNNSTAPLDFIEKKARKIILKTRRKKLINQKKQELYDEANYNDNIKVFIRG